MPRISAPSVAEHVAHQERAVFDAAIALFEQRGYAAVSLADIAAEVGLKRNSLYRYFPDKAHILLAWYRTELPRQVAESKRLLGGCEPPEERLRRWVEAQLDYARTPEHALVVAFAEVSDQLQPDDVAELGESHAQLLAPLTGVVAQAGVPAAEVSATVSLLGSMVLAASRVEESDGPNTTVRTRLHAAIAGLIGS